MVVILVAVKRTSALSRITIGQAAPKTRHRIGAKWRPFCTTLPYTPGVPRWA